MYRERAKEEAYNALRNAKQFDMLVDYFVPVNMSLGEFDEFLKDVGYIESVETVGNKED